MEGLSGKVALLVIDVQQGFDSPYWGVRNNPGAEANIAKLLELWRRVSGPVVHVRHMSTEPESPLRPGQPGNDFKPEALPIDGEHIEEKQVNSGFIGTQLEQYLRRNQIDTVVIVGLTTDHCVSTTTRMAGNFGFKVYVVEDATATFDRVGHDGKHYSAEDIHRYALTSLHNEFATVVSTDYIVKTYKAAALLP